MDGFRVSRGEKRIEVNDDGEYITLNVSDRSFLKRLADIVDKFNAKLPELNKKLAALDALPDETQADSFEKCKLAIAYDMEVHSSLKDEIDALFHDDVCRKVFGDIVPSADMYAEFFEALTPFIQKYANERNEKLSKYSPNRTGNV